MLDEIFDNVEPRLEIKILEDGLIIPEFKAWLFTHPSAFKIAFPSRQVNNVYFDTLGLDSYIDHVSGIKAHNKLRFRWYGKSYKKVSGNLELKRKESDLSKKILYPIRSKIDLETGDWTEVSECLKTNSNNLFKVLLINSQPVLISNYMREYYVSGNNKFRVTIDNHMEARDQRNYKEPNLSFQTPLISDVIIEVKCEKNYIKIANDFLKEIPFRTCKNSKYISALSAFL